MEEYLSSKGEKLVAKAPTPLSNGYRPEIDMSPELESADALDVSTYVLRFQ